MTEFFQLGRQRATSGGVVIRIDDLPGLISQRLPESLPGDGGVAIWKPGVDHAAVLDERECRNDQRRDG